MSIYLYFFTLIFILFERKREGCYYFLVWVQINFFGRTSILLQFRIRSILYLVTRRAERIFLEEVEVEVAPVVPVVDGAGPELGGGSATASSPTSKQEQHLYSSVFLFLSISVSLIVQSTYIQVRVNLHMSLQIFEKSKENLSFLVSCRLLL